jgi:membrane protein
MAAPFSLRRLVIMRVKVTAHVFRVAVSSFMEHGCLNLAAALAFFSILSSIPFMLILISLTSKVLGVASVDAVVREVAQRIFPASSLGLLNDLKHAGKIGGFLGGLGTITLISTATVFFRSLEFSLGVVFRVEKRRRKHKSFLMSLATIPLAGVFLILSFVFTWATNYLQRRPFLFYDFNLTKLLANTITLEYLVPYVMMAVMFTMIYKVVPNRKIGWKFAFSGGLMCAFLWELAKHLFTLYVDRFSTLGDLYGHFGTVVILILWIFYSSAILLFCAEVISNYQRKDIIFLAKVLTGDAREPSDKEL